ncbi:MAG: BatD family protein [Bacteroidota bacterium]|uniref:BatD family protein n=1 Tax=Hydrotalea lipotrueae TaxID=2803817 RepID=UPI001C454A35|nr:BatD family protein [Hydrotalea lipotrueae]
MAVRLYFCLVPMVHLLKYYLLVGLLTLPGVSVFAQSNFQINTTYTTIGLKETLQVSYTYAGLAEMQNWEAPDFKNWNIISGPDFQTQQVYANGKYHAESNFVYLLQPKKTGKLVVPAAGLQINNTTLHCKPLAITVQQQIPADHSPQAGVQMPGGFFEPDEEEETTGIERNAILFPGEDAAQKTKENIFVRVEASKSKCVVGEPILVTYTLYSRLRTSAKLIQQPAFNGCTVYEMTTQDLHSEKKQWNGKMYNTFIIRKVQLIPLTTGTITLNAATVQNTVTFYTLKNNAVNGSVDYSGLCSNAPMQLTVMALPLRNKPEHFTGAIGHFTMNARVEKKTDTAGDVNRLVIEIKGNGNFSSVTDPAIIWPKNIAHYSIAEESEVNKLVYPAEGTKTFTIPFTCKQQGNAVIPAITYNFYNTETGDYQTIQTDSIPIQVGPALKNFINPDLYTQGNTNPTYIWIIPGIGLIVAIGWWIVYGRQKKAAAKQEPGLASATQINKTTAQETGITANTQESPIVQPIETNHIYELLTIPDDISFFKAVKAMALVEEERETDSSRKEALQELIAACNRALYAKVANTNRYDIAEQLKILFIPPA